MSADFDDLALFAIVAFMDLEKTSIAHAKNTLSSLVKKVACGKTRVVLESRGKPKAALISAEHLEILQRLEQHGVTVRGRLDILARARELRGKIRHRRKKILRDSAVRLNRLRHRGI